MDRRDARMKTLSHLRLRFVAADPNYITLCQNEDNYRVRSTPKPHCVEGQDGFTNVFDLMDGSVNSSCQLLAFRSLTTPSQSTVANRVPFGENASGVATTWGVEALCGTSAGELDLAASMLPPMRSSRNDLATISGRPMSQAQGLPSRLAATSVLLPYDKATLGTIATAAQPY